MCSGHKMQSARFWLGAAGLTIMCVLMHRGWRVSPFLYQLRESQGKSMMPSLNSRVQPRVQRAQNAERAFLAGRRRADHHVCAHAQRLESESLLVSIA